MAFGSITRLMPIMAYMPGYGCEVIPVSAIQSYIKKRYKNDENFREIYNDYLTYLDAHRFWSRNPTDVAPIRRREYDELVSEMEIELIQTLKKDADESF